MHYSQAFDYPQYSDQSKRIVVGIPTKGCRWWRGGKGCIHCSVAIVVALHPNQREPLDLVIGELERWRNENIESVCLYTPGSILDESEIPHKQVSRIVAETQERLSPKKIIVEARPELIRTASLAELKSCVEPASLEVCIPLESSSTVVRCVLGKDFSNEEFVEAVERVKRAGCLFSTVLILKAPGLSEVEAILDVRSSLRWLLPLRPHKVCIEPMVVYEHTKLETMYRERQFTPPWVWSLYASVEENPGLFLEIGGEFRYPPPVGLPMRCHRCPERIESEIRESVSRSKGKRPFVVQPCECLRDWLREIDGLSTFLRDTI